MRSSKSRSRSKSNRSRSVGNIVNRVFDSSGPEGKVRGTPQQIIDKYSQLARDATLSNDRVAAENFQQHAEHYTRMLGDAQREMEAKREQQEAQAQAQRENRQKNQDRNQQNQGGEGAESKPQQGGDAPAEAAEVVDPIATAAEGDSGLVETPENKPQPKPRKPRTRKPRAEKAPKADAAPAEAAAPAAEDAPAPTAKDGSSDVAEAAE